jgi:hypothetical protein
MGAAYSSQTMVCSHETKESQISQDVIYLFLIMLAVMQCIVEWYDE